MSYDDYEEDDNEEKCKKKKKEENNYTDVKRVKWDKEKEMKE